MASLTAKVVHGHKYFQIITSRRINGKPRQVVLAHLGTADTLFARLQQKQGEPIKARVQPFGFLAAAWGLAQKLQLVSLIDRHVPKRQQGASVGQYLVLAALNRLTSPHSYARLAPLVSTALNPPLFARVYPGTQPDSVTFGSVTPELIERYRVLAKNLEHVTLVFDKGNNSEENLEALGPSPYHVVGSLVPPDLLEVPLDKFQSFQDARLEGVIAFRTSKKVFGRHWTIVATHSQELLEGQLRGIAQVLGKRRRALGELQGKLKRSQEPGAKGKGYTFESLEAHAQNLSSGQYIQKILRVEIGRRRGKLQLHYHTDAQALEKLIATSLGRRILFTDNHQWTTEEIILAYRSQHHVEAAFRTMKDPHFVGWEPLYHWTDQKIRVHAFYCVLALTLAGLLHREAHRAGLELSLGALCRELSSICEIINLYPSTSKKKAGRLRASTTYTELTPTTSRLAEIFRLHDWEAR